MKWRSVVRRVTARVRRRRQQQSPHPPVTPLPGALLQDRCALITGAGHNIGRAVALEMAQQGAAIIFTEIDGRRAQALQQDLARIGVPHHCLRLDASDMTTVSHITGELAALEVTVDILVNNVALQPGQNFMDLGLAQWQKSFDTNVSGPALLSQTVARTLIDAGRPGSILFITSIHQWEPALWPAYSSAKAALGMLIQEMAAALAPHTIRVNGIAPGWVAPTRRPSRFSLLHGTTIDPTYIGRAAVFLASDHTSAFTTGAVLVVDAGLSLLNSRIVQEMDRRNE